MVSGYVSLLAGRKKVQLDLLTVGFWWVLLGGFTPKPVGFGGSEHAVYWSVFASPRTSQAAQNIFAAAYLRLHVLRGHCTGTFFCCPCVVRM